MRESWSKNKKKRKKRKRELRRIYRHRDSMHWLKPTFLPELFELGYILLRKCISPRHQSLMAPSGLSAYPTPKFVGYVFIPRCAPLEKSVDTRAFPSLHAQRTRNTSGVRRAGLRCFAADGSITMSGVETRWVVGWPVRHPPWTTGPVSPRYEIFPD